MPATDLEIKKLIADYREKLLDTSKRNNSISFNHSVRSRRHIRVIDELPDFLYQELLGGKTLTFRPLPDEDSIPPDEKTSAFLGRLEQLKLTDKDYKEAIDGLNENEEGAREQIERDLRNKVRQEQGRPVWEEQKILSNEEIARKHDLNPSYEMPEPSLKNQQHAERHTDEYIQTLLKQEEMNHKLRGLYEHIRSSMKESGVNTLYVAFGFLEWYEKNDSEKEYFAPLLLLRLEIKEKISKKGLLYRVRWDTGDEPQVNLSLSKKLKQDGIDLPEFTKEDGPETYMTKVAELIRNANKKKWRVRRFITVGHFSFTRLAMYEDLGEDKWPDGKDVSTHEIVRKLFVGSNSEVNSIEVEDYDIDTLEDPEAFPLLIAPADASQHSALVDVMRGENLAIEGPPGTGKSQTITNIIANALSEGKTVLFLAEKMAALDVVYKRLGEANLAPYCLKLHSTATKKKEIADAIEARLELRTSKINDRHLKSKIKEFKQKRDVIQTYLDVMKSDFGRQHKTIHDYLWAARLSADQIGSLRSLISQANVPFEQADLTESELSQHIDDLEIIATLKQDVDSESDNGKHPWHFVSASNLGPFQREELRQVISLWVDHLQTMQESLNGFTAHFGLSITPNPKTLQSFFDDTETLVTNWDVDTLNWRLFATLGTVEKTEALLSFVEDIKAYRQLQEKITTFKNILNAIPQIKDIEQCATTATDLDVSNMTAVDIQDRIKTLEEELHLWDAGLKPLLDIGQHFDVSENDDISKIRVLTEALGHIATIPRNYLLTKTKEIVDERNHECLEAAADAQKAIRNSIKKQEEKFDLSMMGNLHEIRGHADTLAKAGVFAFFLNPSYRNSRKHYIFVSKHKQKFKLKQAFKDLRDIADIIEKRQEIEQDTRLQTVCGSYWNGFDTDFEALQKINEWATLVRKYSLTRGKFTRNVCLWLLDASMENLDPVWGLVNNNRFIALKDKITDITEVNTSVSEYLNGLRNKINELRQLGNMLQSVASNDAIKFADITENLPWLHKAAEIVTSVKNHQDVKQIFGENYAGVETDIKDIARTAQFISECLAVPSLKNGFKTFLNEHFSKHWGELVKFRDRIEKQHEAVKRYATQAQEHSQINFSSNPDAAGWENLSYTNLITFLKTAMAEPDSLKNWIDLSAHIRKASQDIKGNLLAIYEEEKLEFETLPLAFKYMIYTSIAHEIYRRNPGLDSISGLKLERSRARIKELDKEIVKLKKDQLCNKLNGNHPHIPSVRKNPIRDLMRPVQKIKPCFLMSPFTVAKYLEPGKLEFDIVVIDEASQMRPEDALGGVARAKQLVVVGDLKQLPPTSHFQGMQGMEEEEFMLMARSSFPSRMLRCHYRSRHESLIAFSNYYFYHGNLVLFPSPVEDPEDLGVRYEYVGGTYASQSNMDEVRAVVNEALCFMKKHPDRSLGIATLNQVQRDLILSEMALARTDPNHSHVALYEKRWDDTLEPFFVKNLENVQGDERDAIFISTVFGPDKNGKIKHLFGPINKPKGDRRLNVLFTRAKKNMVVFTSLEPNALKTSDNEGVKALQGFLSYAKTRALPPDGGLGEPESPFEISVMGKLESMGCKVHPQVGHAGYRIDLGVKHPKFPYGYLLGVECDGATYHSSKSARERDVIRQQVLEGLGWHIYRIWSTDWFSNPPKEFEKLKNHIEALLDNKNHVAETPDGATIEQDFIEEETDWPEDSSQSELDI